MQETEIQKPFRNNNKNNKKIIIASCLILVLIVLISQSDNFSADTKNASAFLGLQNLSLKIKKIVLKLFLPDRNLKSGAPDNSNKKIADALNKKNKDAWDLVLKLLNEKDKQQNLKTAQPFKANTNPTKTPSRTDCLNLHDLSNDGYPKISNTNMNYSCPEIGWEHCVRICANSYEINQVEIITNGVSLYCENGTTIEGRNEIIGIMFGRFEDIDIMNGALISETKINNCHIKNFALGISGHGHNVEITNNSITNVEDGISIKGLNVQITNNQIANSIFGIDLRTIVTTNHESRIKNNKLEMMSGEMDSSIGIFSTGGEITDNIVKNYQYGMFIPNALQAGQIEGSPIKVYNNNISGFQRFGIWMPFTLISQSYTEIKKNIIESSKPNVVGIVVFYVTDPRFNQYDPQSRYIIQENMVKIADPTSDSGIVISGNSFNWSFPESKVTYNSIIGSRFPLSVLNNPLQITISNNKIQQARSNAILCQESQQINWSCNNCGGSNAVNFNCNPSAFCQEICNK